MSHAKIKVKIPKVDLSELSPNEVLDLRDDISADLQKLNKARAKLGQQMAGVQKILAAQNVRRKEL